jgi:hypothetical protein
MNSSIIDVWDIRTFDAGLIAFLEPHVELVCSYMGVEHEIFLSHDLGRGQERHIVPPENPYHRDFLALEEAAREQMEQRTIRAFHYTRLTDDEVAKLKLRGIHLSTPETLKNRLDQLVIDGIITSDIASALYKESPFHGNQQESRTDKFWMVSHPVCTDDSGVTRFMRYWGGEVASFWNSDDALLSALSSIGHSRIIETAVPMIATRQSFTSGKAVIATFARSHGAIPCKHDFDLYVTRPLPSSAILLVHTEGDATFERMAQGYPEGFIDVDVRYWQELTGDD